MAAILTNIRHLDSHFILFILNQSYMVKNKAKQVDMHWIPALFTKNGKYDMIMFSGCFHGYSPTCQLHIRSKIKVDACPKLSNDI